MTDATPTPTPAAAAAAAPDSKVTAAFWAALMPYMIPALKPVGLLLAGALAVGVGTMTGGRVGGEAAMGAGAVSADDVAGAITLHAADVHPGSATSDEVAELRAVVDELTGQMGTVLYVVCRSAAKQGIETAECRGQ